MTSLCWQRRGRKRSYLIKGTLVMRLAEARAHAEEEA
jgi:hypothetical protein